jgi:hypothetical protein
VVSSNSNSTTGASNADNYKSAVRDSSNESAKAS